MSLFKSYYIPLSTQMPVGKSTHTYVVLFFHKLTYIRYDVSLFVEHMDFSLLQAYQRLGKKHTHTQNHKITQLLGMILETE
jgi:hypothetical protein